MKEVKVLFQGDSVTDCGRNRETDDLGQGYPKFAAEKLNGKGGFLCVNRGVSGNRVKDLEARWTKDCIEMKPDILAVLIGVNDTWRAFDSADPTTAESFYETYDRILTRVRSELPNTKIILLEQFIMPLPVDRQSWRVDIDPKIQCTRALARKFKTEFIPLDGLLAEKSITLGCEAICADGVHPTETGHKIIAELVADKILEMCGR